MHLCSTECWRLYHQHVKNWQSETVKRTAAEEATSDLSTSSSDEEKLSDLEEEPSDLEEEPTAEN